MVRILQTLRRRRVIIANRIRYSLLQGFNCIHGIPQNAGIDSFTGKMCGSVPVCRIRILLTNKGHCTHGLLCCVFSGFHCWPWMQPQYCCCNNCTTLANLKWDVQTCFNSPHQAASHIQHVWLFLLKLTIYWCFCAPWHYVAVRYDPYEMYLWL